MGLETYLLLLTLAVLFFISLPLPLYLLGKFRKHPNLGIAVWLLALCLLSFCIAAALAIGIVSALTTYQSLAIRDSSSQTLAETLLFSLLPWALIGGTGILIAIVSTRLEPLKREAEAVRELYAGLGSQTGLFQGVRVLESPLTPAFALATKFSGNPLILISKGAKSALSEAELKAVLWHEWTHIKRGHLAINSIASRLSIAVPWSWFAKCMKHEVNLLAELSADLKAVKMSSPAVLSSAKEKLNSLC